MNRVIKVANIRKICIKIFLENMIEKNCFYLEGNRIYED